MSNMITFAKTYQTKTLGMDIFEGGFAVTVGCFRRRREFWNLRGLNYFQTHVLAITERPHLAISLP